MAIDLKQYAGKTVTAQDDAILNDQLCRLNGIIKGCSTHFISVNVVNVEAGWGIMKGRMFKISETTLNCALPDADGVGIVKIKMDLTNKDAPAQILSVVAAGEVYPDLEQDEECNFNNGIYEIELARYTATPNTITNFVQTAESLDKQLQDKDNMLREKILDLVDQKIDVVIKQSSITKAVLPAGATTVTITDSRITTNSALSFYTSIYGVNPTDVSVAAGSVTLTFDAQDTDMKVGVRVDG